MVRLGRLLFIKRLYKNTKLLIKKKKKTKCKPKNPNRISRSKFKLTLTSNSISSLQIHIRITCSKPTTIQEKKIQKVGNNRRFRSNNRRFRSNLVHSLQQQTIQKVGIFSPFFCFLFNYRFQGFQKYMGLVEGRPFFPPFFPIQLPSQTDRQIDN